jgi:hypothetical protein
MSAFARVAREQNRYGWGVWEGVWWTKKIVRAKDEKNAKVSWKSYPLQAGEGGGWLMLMICCCVDAIGWWESADTSLCWKLVYVRFHGVDFSRNLQTAEVFRNAENVGSREKHKRSASLHVIKSKDRRKFKRKEKSRAKKRAKDTTIQSQSSR